ncbi:MAG: hypothetical protein KJP00_04070 [Bacteroidia bacterium]|nr:hypothetical protein [Bacteroidia bacterium]
MTGTKEIVKLPAVVIWIYFVLISIILAIVAICDNVTGDEGDSISHYMFSRYSWENPEYFIHHWSKPVFTLLSSPFSQFGFVGIRCFNLMMALGTAYCVWKIAVKLHKPISSFAILILFSISFYTLKMFSGYTEYLYAFLLVYTILLCLNENYVLASIIVSFFPFCRSEGIIALAIFAVYLVWVRHWKYLPLLILGHVIYEVIGVVLFDQLIGWTWIKIPYLGPNSGYGSGRLFDMADELIYRTGIPIILLVLMGIIYRLVGYLSTFKSLKNKAKVDILLIYGNVVAFFIAHTIFWTFGLFNSLGLGRVYIAIMPLIALMTLDGFGFVRGNLFSVTVQKMIVILILATVVYAPFDKDKIGFRYVKGINNIPQNDLIKDEVHPYLMDKFPGRKVYYNVAYLAILRKENYYAQGTQGTWFRKPDLENMESGTLFLWDSKFAKGDAKIFKEDLETDVRFRKHNCFVSDTWNGYYTYCVFERI